MPNHLLSEEYILIEGHPVGSTFHPGICPLHLHYHKHYKVVEFVKAKADKATAFARKNRSA